MSPELARIEELENALAGAIAYLRRMPVNAETYRQANAADAVLKQELRPSVLGVAKYTPAGVLAIAARLDGFVLTVNTQSSFEGLTQKFQDDFRNSLFESLKREIKLELSPQDKYWK